MILLAGKRPHLLVSYQVCLSCDKFLRRESNGESYLQYELPREGDVVRNITLAGMGIQHIKWVRINIGDVDAWTWKASLSVVGKIRPITIPIAINMMAIGYHTCALQICMHQTTDVLWMQLQYELYNDEERYHLARSRWYETVTVRTKNDTVVANLGHLVADKSPVPT